MAAPTHAPLEPARFSRAVRWLEAVCLGFVALGAVLPFAYATPPFAPYRAAVADAIGDPALAANGATLRLVLGITGGSIAGKWALHWAVVRHGLRARRRWARDATLAGLCAWFVLDSASSLLAGAWANVVMVNLLPPLLLLPALALVWRDATEPCAPPREPHVRPARLALATALLGAASGAVIALGMDTRAFDVWRAGLGAALFGGGEVPAAARALVRYFSGPIGGATLGQFVLAAYVARFAMPAGERWAWRASLASVLLWALLDSAYSLSAGASFNVVLVNLPCVAVLAPPLVWAALRAERARA